jgi:CheY-like chemotaxis protein
MPSPCWGDFDGDGDLDLITGEFLDGFTFFENTGTRTKPVYAAGRALLLVEDDAFTRTLLADMLGGNGFETHACASSREALEAFEAFDPDVLVVDIQLERPPNGAQLAHALHARAPYLGVVVISQYPSPSAANVNSPLPPGAAFVHKGRIDSADVVLQAIESVMDDRIAPATISAGAGDSLLGRCSAAQVSRNASA